MMTPAPELTPDSALLPKGTGPARVLVCEREGRWAVALGRGILYGRPYGPCSAGPGDTMLCQP